MELKKKRIYDGELKKLVFGINFSAYLKRKKTSTEKKQFRLKNKMKRIFSYERKVKKAKILKQQLNVSRKNQLRRFVKIFKET